MKLSIFLIFTLFSINALSHCDWNVANEKSLESGNIEYESKCLGPAVFSEFLDFKENAAEQSEKYDTFLFAHLVYKEYKTFARVIWQVDNIRLSRPKRLQKAVELYQKYGQAYIDAKISLANRQFRAQNSDNRADVLDWSLNAELYRMRLRSKEREWTMSGYKKEIEEIAFNQSKNL